jgi:hypothetical protein
MGSESFSVRRLTFTRNPGHSIPGNMSLASCSLPLCKPSGRPPTLPPAPGRGGCCAPGCLGRLGKPTHTSVWIVLVSRTGAGAGVAGVDGNGMLRACADEGVPGRLFAAGVTGGEDVDAFRRRAEGGPLRTTRCRKSLDLEGSLSDSSTSGLGGRLVATLSGRAIQLLNESPRGLGRRSGGAENGDPVGVMSVLRVTTRTRETAIVASTAISLANSESRGVVVNTTK